MDTTVLTALITSSVSIILSSWTSFSQIRIERLRSKLAKQQAEQNAELDYVYGARKKLYQECTFVSID